MFRYLQKKRSLLSTISQNRQSDIDIHFTLWLDSCADIELLSLFFHLLYNFLWHFSLSTEWNTIDAFCLKMCAIPVMAGFSLPSSVGV